jgi:phage head maturation protease
MVNQTFQYSINDSFQCTEVTIKGEKQYFVEGYISTIDQDKSGEIIEHSAQVDIYNQIQKENITMDIEHEEWYDSNGKMLARPKNEKIPVAKIVHAELRPQGVWVKAQINTNLRSFNELWGSIKDGFLKAFSVAFYPIQKAGNIIKSLNLVNVTLTGSPVNPNATFSATMKSAVAWMDSKESEVIIKSEEIKMAEIEQPIIAEVKAEMVKEEMVEKPVVDVKAVFEAEIASLKAKLEEAEKTHSEEVAKLKAELEKPVMKAVVEEKMPESKPVYKAVSPLNLI